MTLMSIDIKIKKSVAELGNNGRLKIVTGSGILGLMEVHGRNLDFNII